MLLCGATSQRPHHLGFPGRAHRLALAACWRVRVLMCGVPRGPEAQARRGLQGKPWSSAKGVRRLLRGAAGWRPNCCPPGIYGWRNQWHLGMVLLRLPPRLHRRSHRHTLLVRRTWVRCCGAAGMAFTGAPDAGHWAGVAGAGTSPVRASRPLPPACLVPAAVAPAALA